MAMMQDTSTLAGARAMILPALFDWPSSAGKDVTDCNIWVDFVTDRLVLQVGHVLATRRELEGGDFKRLVGPRIRRALLADETKTAKFERGERRRLMARGSEARAAKPKPAISPKPKAK